MSFILNPYRFGSPPGLDGLDGGTLIRELVAINPSLQDPLTDGGTLIRELVTVGDLGTLTDGGTLIREEVVA